ncbi:MAG TPA: hypothetical protein VNR65_06400 [Geobacterales bacterium]|nr:hypothetical protein [Geobacterales bacterium]
MKTLPSAIFFNGLKRVRNAICAFAAALVLGTAMFAATASIAEEVQLGRDVSKLPSEVQRMRQAILQAVMSGDIEELRIPIDMNELHPIFAKDRTPDPIAYLKSVSADGNGREMLAILFNLLTTGYAIKNAGTKNEMIVWPYHAAIPLSGLTPGQEVEIYRFLPPARVKEMTAAGRYSYYSVGIGRDGVWHYFSRE